MNDEKKGWGVKKQSASKRGNRVGGLSFDSGQTPSQQGCFEIGLFSFRFVIARGMGKPLPGEKAVLVFLRSNRSITSHQGSRKAGVGAEVNLQMSGEEIP